MGLKRPDLIIYSCTQVVEREIRYHVLKDSLCRTKGRLLDCVVGICFCRASKKAVVVALESSAGTGWTFNQ